MIVERAEAEPRGAYAVGGDLLRHRAPGRYVYIRIIVIIIIIIISSSIITMFMMIIIINYVYIHTYTCVYIEVWGL